MGDEFTQAGPVALKVQVHGTGPVKKVDVIKDFRYVYALEPKATSDVAFTWTDDDPANRGPSWYYVRVLQASGEIAWASPIWVHRPASPAPR